ncbi:MAG: glycerol-3-phosphate acyltransferase [Chloroflexi bacterium]|nr:glycerol-3-phosphate acyltransferase [Chloroflexota bacterium]
MIQFILLVVGGYLLGSIPTAYLVARWSRGIDIRKYGSGNVGASNILTVASKWSSLLVIVVDIGKGMVPVYVARSMGLPVYQYVIVGLAAISGHNWPVFLRFNGGRGLLTSLGVIFVLAPWLALALLVFAFAWYPFGLLPLGTLIGLILLPLSSWFFSAPLGIEKSLPITLGFGGLLLLHLVRRFTAPRTASVPAKELFVNRLLFDRDIRDRKAWIKRAPLATDEPKPGQLQH